MITEYTHTFMGIDVTKSQHLQLIEMWDERKIIEAEENNRSVKGITKNMPDTKTAPIIFDTVCSVMQLNADDVRSGNRKSILTLARQICSYLIVTHTELNFTTIAQEIGYIDQHGNGQHCSISRNNRIMMGYISKDVQDEETMKWMRLINDELLKRLQC